MRAATQTASCIICMIDLAQGGKNAHAHTNLFTRNICYYILVFVVNRSDVPFIYPCIRIHFCRSSSVHSSRICIGRVCWQKWTQKSSIQFRDESNLITFYRILWNMSLAYTKRLRPMIEHNNGLTQCEWQQWVMSLKNTRWNLNSETKSCMSARRRYSVRSKLRRSNSKKKKTWLIYPSSYARDHSNSSTVVSVWTFN